MFTEGDQPAGLDGLRPANTPIMADIINAGTNADVDDTSQYFADYEDILNIPVVEDQQIVAQENTGEVYLIIYHLL